MAAKFRIKTTFEPAKTIQPIYTGGEVSLDGTGRLLATCVDEDVLIIDVDSGEPLTRIVSDGEAVTSLLLSPCAAHLVICSRSLSMRIFSLTHLDPPGTVTAELQRALKPHTSPVVSTAIDDSGTLLATGGADGSVKVWDLRGGYATHTFHGHGGVVSSLHLFQKQSRLEDGASTKPRRKGKRKNNGVEDQEMTVEADLVIYLASGAEDGKIRIWDLNKRKSVAVLDAHVSVVRSLDYSPGEDALLSSSRDKTVILWNASTWKSKKVIPILEIVESAGFVSGTNCCYSGGEHGLVRIWDYATGKEVTNEQQARPESESIVSIRRCPRRRFLLSVHQDQTIRVHSLQSLEALASMTRIDALPVTKRISGTHDEIIDLACVGPQRSLLALATNTESIKLISIEASKSQGNTFSNDPPSDQQRFGSDMVLLEGHSDIVICLDVDWSGNWLATGAKDNTARLWRLDPLASSYTCYATFVGHAESLGAVALPRSAPINSTSYEPLNHPPLCLLTGSQDRTIKRWDTSKLKVSLSSKAPHTAAKALYTRVAHEKDINAIDISPTSPLFASASQDKTIKIWSLDDGSVAGILRGHKRGVWSIRFAPQNTPPINLSEGGTSSSRGLIVSGSGDRTVKVWSLSTYTCLLTFEGHSNSVLKVIWLSAPNVDQEDDSRSRTPHQTQPIIASASSDTLIKLWSPYASTDSDHLLTTLDNHTDRIWALATHPAAPFPLISGAADATITCWKDTTSQTVSEATKRASQRIEQDQELQNHIFNKNYRQVITLALQLNHPGRLLRLFEDVVSKTDKEDNSIMGVKGVDEVLASLSQEQLLLLLQRVRDWNTNARTAPVAQTVLHCLLKSYPSSTFVEMARSRRLGTGGGGGKGMRDLLRALEVYTERHYRRIEELLDESYLVEYTLREMDEVSGVGLVNGHAQENGDVVMT